MRRISEKSFQTIQSGNNILNYIDELVKFIEQEIQHHKDEIKGLENTIKYLKDTTKHDQYKYRNFVENTT